MKNILIGLAVALLLFSCKSTQEKVINQLQTERQSFDEFITAAYQDEILQTNGEKSVSPDQLSEFTQEKLANLGLERVLYVTISKRECEKAREYRLEIQFKGDWHLEYYSCGRPPDIIPMGYRKHDLVETWGIDKHWALWVNNDFIG